MLVGGPRSGKSPDIDDQEGDTRPSLECMASNSFSRACIAAIRLAVRCFRKAGVEARSVTGEGTPAQKKTIQGEFKRCISFEEKLRDFFGLQRVIPLNAMAFCKKGVEGVVCVARSTIWPESGHSTT